MSKKINSYPTPLRLKYFDTQQEQNTTPPIGKVHLILKGSINPKYMEHLFQLTDRFSIPNFEQNRFGLHITIGKCSTKKTFNKDQSNTVLNNMIATFQENFSPEYFEINHPFSSLFEPTDIGVTINGWVVVYFDTEIHSEKTMNRISMHDMHKDFIRKMSSPHSMQAEYDAKYSDDNYRPHISLGRIGLENLPSYPEMQDRARKIEEATRYIDNNKEGIMSFLRHSKSILNVSEMIAHATHGQPDSGGCEVHIKCARRDFGIKTCTKQDYGESKWLSIQCKTPEGAESLVGFCQELGIFGNVHGQTIQFDMSTGTEFGDISLLNGAIHNLTIPDEPAS